MCACAEAVSGAQSLSKRPPANPQRSRNLIRAKLAARDGLYSKAIQALNSSGLAPPSNVVFQEMLTKHPQAPPTTLPPGPAPPPTTLPDQIILKSVKSFPKGSAAGLRPSHLWEAVCCPSPDRARHIIFIPNPICQRPSGPSPSHSPPLWCLPCRKKNNGLRPIAVGEVLRRLVSKCLALHVRSSSLSLLTPLQLGVGVRNGHYPRHFPADIIRS